MIALVLVGLVSVSFLPISSLPARAALAMKLRMRSTFSGKAGRNFNPLMCMAAARTVAQVSRIVSAGGIEGARGGYGCFA